MNGETIRNDADVLIEEIDAFREKWGVSKTQFGIDALNNGHFYGRLRKNREILSTTAARVRRYMAASDTLRSKEDQKKAARAAKEKSAEK